MTIFLIRKIKYFALTVAFISTIFLPSPTIAQFGANTEGSSVFQYEVNQILIHIDSKQIKKIITISRPNQEKGHNDRWKEKSEYLFLNDTIIQQTVFKETFYGLKRKNEVVDYNIDEQKIISYEPKYIDSAGYKIYKGETAVKGAIYYWRNQKDSLGNLTEESYYNPSIYPARQFKLFGNDTIGKNQTYYLKNGKWKLRIENYYHKSHINHETFVDSLIQTEYDTLDSKLLVKHIYLTKTFSTFDSDNRQIRIEKYDYADSNEWYQKHILTIKYRKK